MLASLILSLSLLAAAPVAEPVPVPVLDSDVDVNLDYDLAIDLAGTEIDVDMAVDITYTKPEEQKGNRILRFSMTEWHSFLPSSAVDIVVSDFEGPLSYTVDTVEQPGLVLIKVDFRRGLSSGQSLELLVSYSLPSEPPPVELGDTVELILEDQVVVNDAAVAWAFYSDPRADTWRAEFVLPSGFVGPLNDDLWRRRDGTRVLESSGNDFVYDFVVIENDRAMGETVVPFDGHEITVRYWPGDVVWRDRVSNQITDNLPELTELVGREWPDRPLIVQQSAQTLGTSYGGWYTSDDNRITIGRSVSPELILHELSHVWFQYDNLEDRWLIEGLADEFAGLVADGTAGGPSPEASLGDSMAFELGEWANPETIDDLSAAQPEVERWGYQAAWHVVRTTRETIGVEAFTEVTRSILGDTRAYPGPGDEIAPAVDRPRSWREFLDLAADQVGDDEELARLYAAWIEGEWTDRFAQRSAARQRYLALRNRASGGVLPAAVRDPMREWRFGVAGEAMDSSEQFLDDVTVLGSELADHDLLLPANLDERFASSATLGEIDDYRTELVAAGGHLIRFVERSDSLDRRQRIGLIGSDLDAGRSAAMDAFAAGDFTEAVRLADAGEAMLDGALRRGGIRLAVAVSVLAAIVIAIVIVAIRFRRRGGRRQDHAQKIADIPNTAANEDAVETGDEPSPQGPVIDLTDDPDGYTSSSEEITTSQRS